jgi:hypothetical protein
MKKISCAVVLLLALGCAGCHALDAMNGSGNVISESRPVKDFTGIELSGSGKLLIEQSDVESLTIVADDNLLPELKAEVRDSRLILGTNDSIHINPTALVTYKLLVKRLNSIGVSGGAEIDVKGLRTDSLTVAVSGAGDITITGETDDQNISISGAGKYRADGFKSKKATVNISGIGSALLAVSDKLDVHVSGAGEVEYVGDPQVTQEVSGAGTVRKGRMLAK